MNLKTVFAIGISLMVLLSGCGEATEEVVTVFSTPESKPSHRNSPLKIAPDFTLLDGSGNMEGWSPAHAEV